ncbi:MAG: ABC transporter permease [Gemmatimonadota bacterium]
MSSGSVLLGARWRKVMRDVWLHKARTVLVVLAIVVGIVGAGAVLDTWSLLRRVTREGYLATNPPSATLRVSVDSTLLARVRLLPAVRAASARRTVTARVRTSTGWHTALLFSGADMGASDIGRIEAVSGMWPPADGTLTIEKSSLEFSSAAQGDSVELQLSSGVTTSPLVLPIEGVARDAGLAPGWMEHVVYGFVSPATLTALGGDATPNQLRIVVRDAPFDRDHIRRVAGEVARLAGSLGHEVTEVDVPVPGRHMHAGQMDSLLFTQGAFGVLSLLLSALLVVNLMTAMLVGQTREIGVMKAIGASAWQIAAQYLALALVLGLVAAAIAIPVAAAIAWQYAAFSAELLNFDVSNASIPLGALLVQAVVGMLLPVLAALLPVWRGCRISVNDALRDGASVHEPTPSGWIMTLGRGARSRPFLLSLRNTLRRRQRAALTVTTLALGGAVYLGALGLRTSIRDSVDVLFTEQLQLDMSLRMVEPFDASVMLPLVASVDGVARVEAWSGAQAAVEEADGLLSPAFAVTGLPDTTMLVRYPLIDGAWLGPGDLPEIVVNARLLADQPALTVGRAVSLVVNGQSQVWRVRGVVESGPSPAAYVSPAALARVLGESRVRSLTVRASSRSLAEQSELLQRIRDRFGEQGIAVANASLVGANRGAVEDHLLMVSGFLLVMSELAIVIGGLGLMSTMSLAVLERTREIGVLRAIGASHGAILVMVEGESLLLALASWLVAIPLSLPVSVLLGQAFGRIMMPVPVRWTPDPQGVLVWLVLVVVVSLLSAALPAQRAMRITTGEALAAR